MELSDSTSMEECTYTSNHTAICIKFYSPSSMTHTNPDSGKKFRYRATYPVNIYTEYISHHQMVEHQGYFYVVGGQGNTSKDLIIINGTTWKAERTPSPITSIIESHTMVKLCNSENQLCLVIYGGYTDIGMNKRIYIYNIGKAKWTVSEVNPLYLRAEHTAVVIDRKMYVFGGLDENGQRINSTCMFEINTLKWETLECKNYPKVSK